MAGTTATVGARSHEPSASRGRALRFRSRPLGLKASTTTVEGASRRDPMTSTATPPDTATSPDAGTAGTDRSGDDEAVARPHLDGDRRRPGVRRFWWWLGAITAAAVALFALLTSTPAGIGIVVGGRLADTRGRKVVGSVSAICGTALLIGSFSLRGPAMWVAATLGGIVMAPLDPIAKVYGPELFPTSLRAKAAGMIATTAMAGSVVGLIAAGALRDAFGSFGPAMAILALGPAATAVLVALRFPETARRELEDLNPEDRLPDRDAPAPQIDRKTTQSELNRT